MKTTNNRAQRATTLASALKINLTENEVADRFGIGRRHLRLMRARGSGPRFLKVSGRLGQTGGRILYPIADFEEWLDSLPSGGTVPSEAAQ
jgi:hypothetical protein